MTMPDPVMTIVGEAIGLGRAGDRGRARDLLQDAWTQVGENGDSMHRVGIAHSMADLQDDPADELVWDLRALQAADELTDARVADPGIGTPVAEFYPSLHLNLGEVCRRLGLVPEAADHVQKGRECAQRLGWAAEPPEGYQAMVLDALDRLAARLAADAATGG